MKNIRLAISLAIILFAGVISAKAQSADDIIQKHIAAIGGTENWKAIKTFKMSGSINMGGTELPLTMYHQPGKGRKIEFSFNGMVGFDILTLTEGWSYMPFMGQTKPEAQPEDMVKTRQDELDLQPLIDYKSKGYKAVFLGKDDYQGTECFKVKLTLANGKEETYFFDASNYYHIRSVSKIQANGKEMEEVSGYSNFQKFPEGILFPMTMESTQGGQITFKSLEINKGLPDNIFKPQ